MSQGAGRRAGQGAGGEPQRPPKTAPKTAPKAAPKPTPAPKPAPPPAAPASPPPTQASPSTPTSGRARRVARPHRADLLRLTGRERPTRERKRHRSSVEEARETLLGGPRELTLAEFAERAGTSVEMAQKFWRGMGFPNVREDARVFTAGDVESLRGWNQMVERGIIDEQTMLSLLRALSYTVDQLAMWQVEAAVDFQERRWDLDDIAARIVVLNGLSKTADFGIEQLVYSWRRRMAAAAERLDNEIIQRSQEPEHGDVLPLPRALGFVDMVAFTSRARQLGSRGLAELVQGFEFTARDIVTANGARVVKTVGDAVLFIADDLLTAANIALTMIEAIRANPILLPVRSSLVWGRVVSRSGDIFGPAVNLASRLIDVAPKDTVYMDETTGAMLAKHPKAGDFVQIQQQPVTLQGIGTISPIELRWAAPAAHSDLWIPV